MARNDDPGEIAMNSLLSLVATEQTHQLALNADPVGWKDAHLVGSIGGLERNGGAPASEALESCLLLVDQRYDDVAGFGPVGFLEHGDIAVENAGLDHAVAAYFQRKMLPG